MDITVDMMDVLAMSATRLFLCQGITITRTKMKVEVVMEMENMEVCKLIDMVKNMAIDQSHHHPS